MPGKALGEMGEGADKEGGAPLSYEEASSLVELALDSGVCVGHGPGPDGERTSSGEAMLQAGGGERDRSSVMLGHHPGDGVAAGVDTGGDWSGSDSTFNYKAAWLLVFAGGLAFTALYIGVRHVKERRR